MHMLGRHLRNCRTPYFEETANTMRAGLKPAAG
jgi:hypothetical protein